MAARASLTRGSTSTLPSHPAIVMSAKSLYWSRGVSPARQDWVHVILGSRDLKKSGDPAKR